MKADFDLASAKYDREFTNTLIGRAQRARVWQYLNKSIGKNQTLNILELNCGTGEDAVYLAQLGHKIHATDISSGMMKTTLEKAQRRNLQANIKVERLDINKISQHSFKGKYDLIFSNFGGINCISEKQLTLFQNGINDLLEPAGRLILVAMPRKCIMETGYFLLKGKMKEAFRRSRPSVDVNVSGQNVRTWYYSPLEINKIFQKGFSLVKTRPVGLFIPPSYLEAKIKKHLTLFKLLTSFEKVFGNISWLSNYADHFYIELKLK